MLEVQSLGQDEREILKNFDEYDKFYELGGLGEDFEFNQDQSEDLENSDVDFDGEQDERGYANGSGEENLRNGEDGELDESAELDRSRARDGEGEPGELETTENLKLNQSELVAPKEGDDDFAISPSAPANDREILEVSQGEPGDLESESQDISEDFASQEVVEATNQGEPGLFVEMSQDDDDLKEIALKQLGKGGANKNAGATKPANKTGKKKTKKKSTRKKRLTAEEKQRRLEAEAIYGSSDEVAALNYCHSEFGDADNFTITKMTSGLRDPNRVNIFIDGSFAFSLDVAQVVDLDVKVKQTLTPARLKVLRDASEFGKLYQSTLEWVLTRPHSVRETNDYLRRRKYKRKLVNRKRAQDGKRLLPEFRDDTIELVVQRLMEKKYLDDLKFAKFYVENRYIRRGISKKRLKSELFQKGVSDDLIKRALSEVERPENEEIIKVIRKKRKKYDDFQLVGYLARQGFDLQEAKEAVANFRPEDEPFI